MTTYRIKDWEEHYENNESRKVKGALSWVKVPTRHDGKGFRRVARSVDAVEVFCAWSLIQQVAAKHPFGKRGVLADENGAFTAGDLADATGFPHEIFEKAFKLLVQKGIEWLETVDDPGTSRVNPDASGHAPLEEREESRGEERREGMEHAPGTPPTPTGVPSNPVELRHAVDEILSAYPLKVALAAARFHVERAIAELKKKENDPVGWLKARVELYAVSDEGKNNPKQARWWFADKRFDDDPAHWNKREKKDGKSASTPPVEWNGADYTEEEIRELRQQEEQRARLKKEREVELGGGQ